VKISVVVPAFNEERLLGESLAQIKSAAHAFAQRGWDFELIVCDNNSTDRTAEIARAAGAIVVFEPVNQIARARNSGAAAATGDWLIFVDADSRPNAGLFAEVAGQISSGHCLAGGVTVRMDETSGGRVRHVALELRQPDGAVARRLIYFLRNGGVPENRRFQRRIICGGGIGVEPAAAAAGAGNEPENYNFAPSSADNFRAEDAALHDAGSPQIAGTRALQPPGADPPRILHFVV